MDLRMSRGKTRREGSRHYQLGGKFSGIGRFRWLKPGPDGATDPREGVGEGTPNGMGADHWSWVPAAPSSTTSVERIPQKRLAGESHFYRIDPFRDGRVAIPETSGTDGDLHRD